MTRTPWWELRLTRRAALARMAAGAAGGALGFAAACDGQEPTGVSGDGRLRVRHRAPENSVSPGLRELALAPGRDGLLYVPAGYRSDQPAPLALLLHGAGAEATEMIDAHRQRADEVGLLLLAPDTRGITWDVIRGWYGPDVAFIDAALDHTFGRCNVDPSRLSVMGFSDGGTYALALGRINGDLFGRIVAYSPGFLAPATPTGKPLVFITHGMRDQILPINETSRRIVPALRDAGYQVDYHEFDGGHSVTRELLNAATAWAAG